MGITHKIRSRFFVLILLAMSAAAYAQFSVSVTFAPPELPVYEQPLCPGDGYLWTPGYWAYSDDDYYWVPGTWVTPPEAGLLWTPAYWSWGDNGYQFNEGYWGTDVGFYGGISYGYGYSGEGYEGGRWQNRQFYYNRSVNNVNVSVVHNVYNANVTEHSSGGRVSYNGGDGGISARPTSQQAAVAHEKHIPPVAAQTEHVQAARAKPELRASTNRGKPPVAATPKPGAFSDHAVVPAKQAGAPYTPPANHAGAQPKTNTPAAHPENSAARPGQPAQNNKPESNSPSAAHQNNRPEPSRNEPAQSSKTPPPQSERSQPQHSAPSAVARPAERDQQSSQPQHTPPAAVAQPAEKPQQQPRPEASKPQQQPRPEANKPQQQPKPEASKPEEKKQDEPPKHEER